MKKTILAALLMMGVSSVAMAQTMSGSSDSSQSQNDSSMGGTGSAGGAMNGSPGTGTASPGAMSGTSDDSTPGPTRPNSDFGNQAPGMADTTPGTNAPSTTRNAAATDRAPLKGANSFTVGEATRRLNRAGYTNVAGLTKDDQSVYHATATKNGTQFNVAMDYRGTITAQPAAQ
jgi:hypothetical protein